MSSPQLRGIEMSSFVAYYRVSTQKQGMSGLGLEAQQSTVKEYVCGQGDIIAEFIEIESGKKADRPELMKAMSLDRRKKAILIIAKLDRLSRNVAFISSLMESKIKFVACDLPEANEFMIHIMSAMAEHERKMISQRTKDALKAAKARGVQLGGLRSNEEQLRLAVANSLRTRKAIVQRRDDEIMHHINAIRASGVSSYNAIAANMNLHDIKAAQGGDWTATQIKRVVERNSKAA